MKKLEELYRGKAKKVYYTDDKDILWLEYTDALTAGDGDKVGSEQDKGKLNNKISALLFDYLKEQNVDNHFVKQISDNEMLVKKVEILPVEVVIRNYAAGSICRRLGLEQKMEMPFPLVEFFYKNDDLKDPLINKEHIKLMNLATEQQVEKMEEISLKVNEILKQLFDDINVVLVDYKLEFGVTNDGKLILSDEISPDTCRLWDKETLESLDKDIFRQDKGSVMDKYTEIYDRIKGRLN
ncbi:phosphoribosylaminoimidazolesuccinocarboxamide synthase [Proteinivorax hydrogeniformans]|uniref:Phosphoribosylaminoimidazole-succinocarboxamide synthase n=1 Tax=Proteinivorax hydrogeniformans TaxID=1826727 RepID=A0AAU8HSP0_9FIRM